MSLSGAVKFLLGFLLAIALLFLAGAGLTRYLLTRLATPPPRPTFPNDPSPTPAQPSPTVAASPSPVAPPPPKPSPSPAGYQARVTQQIGLVVRQDPDPDSAQIGGVDYNQDVIVLEESADKEWQRVRIGSNGIEGWVKAGNTERVN